MTRRMLIAALALAGCVAMPRGNAAPAQRPHQGPALSYGGIGQDVRVGGLVVRPLAVTEDSRCPVNVTCVWGGRLVLQARVSGMNGTQTLSTIAPLALPGGGSLELASVQPPRVHGRSARPLYRFGFRRLTDI